MSLFASLGSARGQQVWVRRVEHLVLRLVSLAFSLASAHAIRWFFAPLDSVDILQPTITWIVAIGFGVLGYFVSRGLALRLMNKERIWAYVPICAVVELVEVFCNYALAAAVIQNATWLHNVSPLQRNVLTDLTYVVLAIIPLVSVLLAVVDMDLERNKQGTAPGARPVTPASSVFSGFGKAPNKGQPKWTTGLPTAPAPAPVPMNPSAASPYAQGYQAAAPSPSMATMKQGGSAAAAPFAPVQVQQS